MLPLFLNAALRSVHSCYFPPGVAKSENRRAERAGKTPPSRPKLASSTMAEVVLLHSEDNISVIPVHGADLPAVTSTQGHAGGHVNY